MVLLGETWATASFVAVLLKVWRLWFFQFLTGKKPGVEIFFQQRKIVGY